MISGASVKQDTQCENQSQSNQALLQIKNLTVAYGASVALSDVNLELAAGQLVGIIGPNGAGKSSLLKAILGMVSHSGQVHVAGQSVAKARLQLAYVPQKSEVRWDFPVTVEDVVLMGRYKHIGWVKFAQKADRAIVQEALEQVEMWDLRRRQISELSGGQQQRVFVARALAQQGEVILLDEPLTGVDTSSQDVIMNLLKELRQQGRLIIMATHDLNTAAQTCDTLICVNRRIVAFGAPSQVFTPEILAETYGGKILTVPNGTTSIIL